ncbi:hypothetical protein JCM8097_001499 [Rhodosporidiobolus ruineniae]
MLRRFNSISSTTSERPPSYRTVDPRSPSPPPAPAPTTADFPSSYRVGAFRALFVTVNELRRHLKLLAAFHRLRAQVEALEEGWTAHLEPKQRWAVFVAVAVSRLEAYLDMLRRELPPKPVVPPLDVVLVLHSYMLNPARFEEDRQRLYMGLSYLLRDLLLTRVAERIDDETFEQHVPESARQQWFVQTKTPFDPLEHFGETKGYELQDPSTHKMVLVPWLTEDGKGYAQAGFTLKSGRHALSHEALGILKFAKDVDKCRYSIENTIAGTSISSFDAPDLPWHAKRAKFLRERLISSTMVQVSKTAFELGETLQCRRSYAKSLLEVRAAPFRPDHILSCYTRGERFSLDLAMAVLRQGTFIDKMHSLGWLDPTRFSDDDATLHRCIARYHAFSDLLASDRTFCVPTLDIDLAWHTHQLKSAYKLDVMGHIGRFVDHDDKVSENTLADGFSSTAKAWRARFGVPYSTCGCHLPSAPPPALSRLKTRFSRSASLSTIPPATLSHSAFDDLSTHASEHNSFVSSQAEAVKKRNARLAAYDGIKRQGAAEERRREKATGKGKEAWEAEDAAEVKRRREHEAAFFLPIPLAPVYGPGGYIVPMGGCVVTNPNHGSGLSLRWRVWRQRRRWIRVW